MPIEDNSSDVDSTYDEIYYEELASEEEIYLEETEEELRSKLISDAPRDDYLAGIGPRITGGAACAGLLAALLTSKGS